MSARLAIQATSPSSSKIGRPASVGWSWRATGTAGTGAAWTAVSGSGSGRLGSRLGRRLGGSGCGIRLRAPRAASGGAGSGSAGSAAAGEGCGGGDLGGQHGARQGQRGPARLPAAHRPHLGGGHPGGVADELAQGVADAARGGQVEGAARVRSRPGGVGVEDGVAQRVEHPGHARPDLPRAQHPAVRVRGGLDQRRGDARPAGGEGGVQVRGEVGDVGGDPPERQAVQRGVDGEPDDAHRAGAVDEDVLRDQPAVRDPRGVGDLQGPGDLRDHPRGAAGGERSLVGEQDVQRDAGGPLVDDVAQRRAVTRPCDRWSRRRRGRAAAAGPRPGRRSGRRRAAGRRARRRPG